MEIIALQEYTDNKVSLYEGEIRNIENNLAQQLINKGVVSEHSDNNSNNSNVEIIKIASIYVSSQPGNTARLSSYSQDSSIPTTTGTYGGGGMLLDGKSLQELIGDKNIIDFIIDTSNSYEDNSIHQTDLLKPTVALNYGSNSYDLRFAQYNQEFRNAPIGISVHGVSTNSSWDSKTYSSIDIYAICI